MSERSHGSQESLDEKSESMLNLQRYVDEASFLINSWYNSRNSDSANRQDMRKTEHRQATLCLSNAIFLAPTNGKDLRVVVPEDEEAVVASVFDKGAYDYIRVRPLKRYPINPGESLILKSERMLRYQVDNIPLVYFGDGTRYLEFSDIAEILGKAGKLELSPLNRA